MRDEGINKGLVSKFETSSSFNKSGMYGFRKMFWKYLKKLNVAFFDPCCADADGSDRRPVAWDESQGQFVTFDGTEWVAMSAFTTSTTTTTTSA